MCVAELDAAGASDCASHRGIFRAARGCGVPETVVRFIGTWLTGRTFRVKLGSPLRTSLSAHHSPSRGVPQGGALPPLLWTLPINNVARKAKSCGYSKFSGGDKDWPLKIIGP